MKRIGVAGPYGDSNYGDYAMMINNIMDIDAKDICVYTYNKKLWDTLSDHYFAESEPECFEIKIKQESESSTKVSKKYEIEFDACDENITEILSKVVNLEELRKSILEIDILVISGGGFFNYLWCARHRKNRLCTILATILLAQQYKKRIVIMGNTFGPYGEGLELFRRVFNLCENITYAVRDEQSKYFVKELGYDGEITVLPDDLYFLSSKLFTSKSDCSWNRPYVVLELYLAIEEIEQNINEIKKMVFFLANEKKMEVVFLPFDVGYGGVLQGAYLKSMIPEIHIISIDEYGFLPIELCNDVIAGAQMVLCNRYHALVTALGCNIPCFMYIRTVCGGKQYYLQKIEGILNLIIGEGYYDKSDYCEITLKLFFNQIIDRYEEITRHQKENMKQRKKDNEMELKKVRKDYIYENI